MPIDKDGAWVVTLDDGTLVRCHVGKVGKEGKYPEYIRTRWLFQAVIDGETVESIGPMYTPIDHEGQLRELVREWWATTPWRTPMR